jgi:ribonuclease HI
MRAELVAIHTALSTFSTHNWIGIFTDSLSRLQASRHHHTNPGTTSAKHYHLHCLLLESITDLLDTRQRSGLNTTLHNIRAHTNIRGNDRADAAAKLAVTQYDTLPPSQKRRVETGEISPRPHHWVMYTIKSPPPTSALSTGTNCATLRRSWWNIPEEDRLQMHAFTRPSPQLRTKVREALLRSLYHSSLYRRFIVANKEKRARTKTVGQALHKKLTHSPWEGTTLLKFLYGQLYNGN